MATNKQHTKKVSKVVTVAEINVLSTFNNIIISLTDSSGNLLSQASSGMVGASGSKKASSYYATMVINRILEAAKAFGVRAFSVVFKGPGINGRDAVVKVLNEYVMRSSPEGAPSAFAVTSLRDATPVPHNGCRARKRRRV